MIWKYLLILLISMVPLIELRGAIPIAVGFAPEIPEWAVLITAIIGNILPVPVIYLFARKFLEWGSEKKWPPLKKLCDFCLQKGQKGGEKLLEKTKGGVYWALFLFVAIPVPGTGAWTGTLAASILNLDFKKTMFSVTSGIITAGLIMLAASLGLFKVLLGG